MFKVEGLPEGRKIIKFQDTSDSSSGQGYLIALCDDGTLWFFAAGSWAMFPVIPKPVEMEKIQPRRIVLEETEEERSISFGDWYEDDVGNVSRYLNIDFGSRRTYKTWREVKETDIPLTNDEPKLSFSVEECRSLQMYGMSDSAVTRRIREFLKGSQTYKKEED